MSVSFLPDVCGAVNHSVVRAMYRKMCSTDVGAYHERNSEILQHNQEARQGTSGQNARHGTRGQHGQENSYAAPRIA